VMRTNSPLSRCLKFLGMFALIALAIGLNANIALAQTGADAASGPNAVFQLEGNTSTDGYVCFGITSTGPIIADAVAPGGGAPTCPSGTNLVTYAVPPTEDWDKIYSGKTVASATTGIVNDLFNSGSDDIYTGGSTKDTNDFGQWLWKNGKPHRKMTSNTVTPLHTPAHRTATLSLWPGWIAMTTPAPPPPDSGSFRTQTSE